jgi:hypothetical protein
MKHLPSQSGTGLVSLHQIDVAVDVEPGASLARHLPSRTLTSAAALSYRWLPRAVRRVAAAGSFAGDPPATRRLGANLADRMVRVQFG